MAMAVVAKAEVKVAEGATVAPRAVREGRAVLAAAVAWMVATVAARAMSPGPLRRRRSSRSTLGTTAGSFRSGPFRRQLHLRRLRRLRRLHRDRCRRRATRWARSAD